MVTVPRQQEFRRRPRSLVSCPVTVEAGNRILQGETLNLGPSGAKLRLDERLQEGTAATLHLTPAEGRPMDVEAIVWRTDDDGSVFFFIKATPANLQPSQWRSATAPASRRSDPNEPLGKPTSSRACRTQTPRAAQVAGVGGNGQSVRWHPPRAPTDFVASGSARNRARQGGLPSATSNRTPARQGAANSRRGLSSATQPSLTGSPRPPAAVATAESSGRGSWRS
jgi:hypothetical protein